MMLVPIDPSDDEPLPIQEQHSILDFDLAKTDAAKFKINRGALWIS
jgi:hypothetical protein